MVESRAHLLDAAQTYEAGSENRLTEILAVVLGTATELTADLFALAGLDPCDRYLIRTQVTHGDGRPDLVVEGLREGGVPSAHLWIEAKLDAEWQPDQVQRYTAAQADLEGEDKSVLCLVRYAPPFEARYVRWLRVAELCERHGRRWGGRNWRETALAGDAPARVRLLAELLWYLHKEGDAVAGEFDAHVWQAFASVDEVLAGVDALLTAAAQQSRPCEYADTGHSYDGERAVYLDPPPGSWLLPSASRTWRLKCSRPRRPLGRVHLPSRVR
jgi:hypothetical protein